MFDADGVLFDSTESNVAYYNWIFEQVGEPPLDRDEEISAVSYAASEVFAARARGDATKLGSSLMVMAIVGGAALPAAMGYISDHSTIQRALIVPLFCYLYILNFAVRSSSLP